MINFVLPGSKPIFFIRHPQTDWNEQKRYQGRSDRPLSAEGEASSYQVEEYFRDIKVDAIVTSPRSHSLTLAQRLAKVVDLEVHVEETWSEIDHGLWEGFTHDEVEQRYSKSINNRFGDPFTYTEHRGETLSQMCTRVEQAWTKLFQCHQGRCVVVTHVTPIQLILCRCLNLPSEQHWKFRIDNCSITSIEVFSSGPIINFVNQTFVS